MYVIKKIIFTILFYLPWFFQRFIIRSKKKIVVGSFLGEKYSDSPKAFYEWIIRNHPEIKICWITKNKEVLRKLQEKKLPVAMKYSIKSICFTLTAKYYVTDHGESDVNQYFLNGAKSIFCWHGMPIKKIGCIDDKYFKKNPKKLKEEKIRYIFEPWNRRRIDFLPISSQFFTSFMSTGFATPFQKKLPVEKCYITGLPRNDELFSTEELSFIKSIKDKYENSTIIFYMPTFRLSIYTGEAFNPFSKRYKFSNKKFNDFLIRNNLVFLYKPHPLEKEIEFESSDRFKILGNNENIDLYKLLGQIDILVTDYSSVYFDFLVLKKHIILTPFDFDEYVSERGIYFDYEKELPEDKAYNWDDFIQILESKSYINVEVDHNKFNANCDNKACERLFNAIYQEE